MAAIKTLLVFVIFSWGFLGFCQGDGGVNPPCVAKLLPCQPYLTSDKAPGALCCVPLKDLVAHDVKCLCQVFDNVAIMKGLNVTQEDALKLAKTCGANADTTLCKTAATPTVSPSTPTTNSSSTTNNNTASAPAKNGANVMSSHFGGSLSLSIAFLLGLFMSSF